MAITAQDVKKLREKTGAGLLDCKKALNEANGDMERATDLLKEWGMAQVAKRSDRSAEEGRVFTAVGENKAAIVEILCETDFVARNEEFVSAGNDIAAKLAAGTLTEGAAEIEEVTTALSTTIKENIKTRRIKIYELSENHLAFEYVHGEAGKSGALVVLSLEKPELAQNDEVKTFAKDCALHAVAFNPPYLAEKDVDQDYMKRQEAIFTAQAEGMDKPEKVIQGIITGKLKKHMKEICFLDQPFVKDDKRSVSQVAADLSKTVGGKVELSAFQSYVAGEEV